MVKQKNQKPVHVNYEEPRWLCSPVRDKSEAEKRLKGVRKKNALQAQGTEKGTRDLL